MVKRATEGSSTGLLMAVPEFCTEPTHGDNLHVPELDASQHPWEGEVIRPPT